MKITPAAAQAFANGEIDNFIAATTEGGIEAQEAAGQKTFVANQTLPKDCPREDLERLGFVFGEDEDDIFITVQFPEGWEKKATEHSMYSDLLDGNGRIRGGIFYKAAFYDRRASMHLIPRYSFSQDYEMEDAIQYLIKDCGKIILRFDKTECEKYSDKYWAAADQKESEALLWLAQNLPNWKDAGTILAEEAEPTGLNRFATAASSAYGRGWFLKRI